MLLLGACPGMFLDLDTPPPALQPLNVLIVTQYGNMAQRVADIVLKETGNSCMGVECVCVPCLHLAWCGPHILALASSSLNMHALPTRCSVIAGWRVKTTILVRGVCGCGHASPVAAH